MGTTSIPTLATVSSTSSSCTTLNSTTSQVITLEWFDTDPLFGIFSRNLSIFFSLNTISTPPVYGVSMVASMYELSRSQEFLDNVFDPGQNSTIPIIKSVSKFINLTTDT